MKNTATFPWSNITRKRRCLMAPPSLEFLQEAVAFILALCTRRDEINATFVFSLSVAPWLQLSGW